MIPSSVSLLPFIFFFKLSLDALWRVVNDTIEYLTDFPPEKRYSDEKLAYAHFIRTTIILFAVTTPN